MTSVRSDSPTWLSATAANYDFFFLYQPYKNIKDISFGRKERRRMKKLLNCQLKKPYSFLRQSSTGISDDRNRTIKSECEFNESETARIKVVSFVIGFVIVANWIVAPFLFFINFGGNMQIERNATLFDAQAEEETTGIRAWASQRASIVARKRKRGFGS